MRTRGEDTIRAKIKDMAAKIRKRTFKGALIRNSSEIAPNLRSALTLI